MSANDDPRLELVLSAREATLPGGLRVRRALPRSQRRMVGPFIFVDQMGPVVTSREEEFTVLPHPHIGLSTVTYLFEGTGLHRDSLGTVQPILPGEVNWMTAGRGIVHSERMRPNPSGRVFGVQTWVALPKANEECPPSFEHYGEDVLPERDLGAVRVRVIAGSLYGMTSGVRVSSPLFYVEARMPAGATLDVPPEYEERSAFVVEGAITVGERALPAGELAVLTPGADVTLRATEPTRLLLLGGEPFPEERFIFWNFVSSAKERLRQAADDWRDQRFPKVPKETEFIPLPAGSNPPVNYP